MYIKEYLNKYNDKKIRLYVDMDGVIADYEFGCPYDYDKKRPLLDSIKKLELLSSMDNIELYILSVTRLDEGIEQKNIWLDKYAPFFKKDNRIIISRESNNMNNSSVLKSNYLNDLSTNDLLIVIDDDPLVLKEINKLNKGIILLKDSALID